MGRRRVNPLILDIKFPGTVCILLLGKYDPNDFGQPDVSPLGGSCECHGCCFGKFAAILSYGPQEQRDADRPLFIAVDRGDITSEYTLVAARADLHTEGIR